MKLYLIALLSLSFLFNGVLYAQEKNRSTTFFSKNPDEVFLGAVMSLKSLNTEEHVVKDLLFNDKVNALSSNLKYEFPSFVPNKENMYAIIKGEMDRLGAPDQAGSSTYSSWSINSLDAIDVSFGQTMNRKLWFGLEEPDLSPKSIIVIEYDVTLFDMYLDIYEDRFLAFQNQVKEEKDDDLFIVNSLTWGRRAMVVIQSDFDDSKARGAFHRFMDNSELSEEDSVIIETANYSYTVFGDVDFDLDNRNPIEVVKKYIEAPITEENFGRVLNMTGINVQNGAFIENVYD